MTKDTMSRKQNKRLDFLYCFLSRRTKGIFSALTTFDCIFFNPKNTKKQQKTETKNTRDLNTIPLKLTKKDTKDFLVKRHTGTLSSF